MENKHEPRTEKMLEAITNELEKENCKTCDGKGYYETWQHDYGSKTRRHKCPCRILDYKAPDCPPIGIYGNKQNAKQQVEVIVDRHDGNSHVEIKVAHQSFRLEYAHEDHASAEWYAELIRTALTKVGSNVLQKPKSRHAGNDTQTNLKAGRRCLRRLVRLVLKSQTLNKYEKPKTRHLQKEGLL